MRKPFTSIKGYKKILFFFLGTLLGFISLGSAQTSSFPDNPSQIKEIPPPPTMGEFQKYGNYPVSLHTGVPDISIPIYTISVIGAEVPISLRYHASGIKVDEKASWVGLGWSLNAGGAITRTVRGSTDEASRGYINYPYYNQGEYDPATDYYKTEEMMQGNIDTEPDIFNYSFLGYSGRFIFNHSDTRTTATISLIPHNDLKITPIFTNAIITGFTVITPEGIVAEFGDYETSQEYRGDGNLGSITVSASSTWHLKKITTPSSQEITFEYNLVPGLNSSSPGMTSDPSYVQTSSIKYDDYCQPNHYIDESSSSNSGINFYKVKRLTQINFPGGYISFQSSSGNRTDDPGDESLRLDDIKIYHKKNGIFSLIHKFSMQYGYFGTVAGSIPDPSYQVRLKLENVIEIGENGDQKNPYQFDYKEGGAQYNLPPRYSYDQDYWGYYNGANNSSLIPRTQITTSSASKIFLGDADREVNPNFSQAGMLERITFPTRGYTEFTYENNTASIQENGVLNQYITGGLRIKNISSFDSDSSLQWEKTYEYTHPNNSSESSGVYNGNTYVTPSDYSSGWTYYFSSLQTGSCPSNVTPMGYNTNSTGVSSSIKQGNNFATVFYKDVKEINGSASNYSGYTWYHYDVTKDDLRQGLGPGMSFRIDRSWDRGQLLLQETFENGNNTPVLTKSFEYENIAIRTPISAYKAGKRFNVSGLGYVPPEQQSYPYNFWYQQYFLTYYEEPIVWKRLKSSSEEKDGITTLTNYYYDANNIHINTKRIVSTNSNGQTKETKFYYPDEITSTSSLSEGGTLTSYEYSQIDRLKKNDLYRPATPIQKVDLVDGNITYVQRTLFDTFSGLVLPSELLAAKGDNTVSSRTAIYDYDESGNPLELSKADGPHIVYLWGYNDQYPIAKIENTTASAVSGILGSLSAIDESDMSSINGLRTSLTDALITTYTYDPLVGVTNIRDPRGKDTQYFYDSFGRLETVKNDAGKLLKEFKYHYKN